MEHLPEFIANHWILSSLFVSLIVAFFIVESRRGGRSLTPQALVNLINNNNAVVLDIRDSTEFKLGHITGAINIPFSRLKDDTSDLKKHAENPIVVVCSLGHTAANAVQTLTAAGYAHVYKLEGGISRWKSESLPLVKK